MLPTFPSLPLPKADALTPPRQPLSTNAVGIIEKANASKCPTNVTQHTANMRGRGTRLNQKSITALYSLFPNGSGTRKMVERLAASCILP